MKSIPRYLIVALTLFCCVGCDQVSKSAARALLASGVTHSFLADSLRLQLVANPGSFLGLGSALPEQLRFALFTGAVAVLLLGVLSAALFARRLDFARFVGLALVAGGGMSNLIDRLMFHGRVTDFLNVGIGSLRTGIFNVADMTILAGALLLLLKARAAPRVAAPQGADAQDRHAPPQP
jgi:signal peptidase II